MTPGQLVRGGVSTTSRRNADKSRTFYLVWHELVGDRPRQRRQKLFKTEPNPDRKSLREWARKAANRAAQMQDYADGRVDKPTVRREYPPLPLNHAILAYLRHQEAAGMAPTTIDAKDRILTSFLHHVGENSPTTRCVHQLSPKHVNGRAENGYAGWATWRAACGISIATQRLELATLKAFTTWCHRRRLIKHPIRFALPAPEPTTRPTIIDTEVVRRAVAMQPDDIRKTAVAILACTGMRPAELRSLQIGSWDGAARVLTIPKSGRQRTKIHHRRLYPGPILSGMLDRIAAARGEEKGPLLVYNEAPLHRHLNHWLVDAGVAPKEFRRWAQYQLEKAGCPSSWIDDLLGHVPAGMRAHYTPGVTDDYRKYLVAMEALVFGE